MADQSKFKGRGTSSNPKNRFQSAELFIPIEWEGMPEEFHSSKRTIFIKDLSKSAITENKSPDVGFNFSVNPYRGCEHGCVYCYARPTHEYLGYSAGLDFESKILVKQDIAQLLRKELSSKKWKPAVINMSGVTDCYQPVERKLELTRSCLKVLNEFRNPVTIITKNHLVTRDIDILSEMALYNGAMVFISVTTLDLELCNRMEPRTSRPQARIDAIRQLSQAGVPVGVMMAPLIVGLTDHEMPKILEEAANAGAKFAGYVPLRLPYAVSELFLNWLTENYPLKRDRIVRLIQSVREGKLNNSQFGSRMKGSGAYADQVSKFFHLLVRKYGLNKSSFKLSTDKFCRPESQLNLFRK